MVKVNKIKLIITFGLLFAVFFTLSAVRLWIPTQSVSATENVYSYQADRDSYTASDSAIRKKIQDNKEYIQIGNSGKYRGLVRFKFPKDKYESAGEIKFYFEISGSADSVTALPDNVTGLIIHSLKVEGSDDASVIKNWDNGTWVDGVSDMWTATSNSGIGWKNYADTTINFSDCLSDKPAESGAYVLEYSLDKSKMDGYVYDGEDGYYYYSAKINTKKDEGNIYAFSTEKGGAFIGPMIKLVQQSRYPENASIAVKDTQVVSSAEEADKNYGGKDSLWVNRERNAYIQFDVTDILKESVAGKSVALSLYTEDELTDSDISALNVALVNAYSSGDPAVATFGWTEGVLNGVIPQEGEGVAWADNAGNGILASRKNVPYFTYEFDGEHNSIVLKFPASCLNDEETLQLDGNNKYITIALIGNGADVDFNFSSKEGKQAPYIEIVDNVSFKGISMTLADEITLNYYVSTENYAIEKLWVKFTFAEGEQIASLKAVGRDKVAASANIAPQFMGETVTATIYYGETALFSNSEYSAKRYLTEIYFSEKSNDAMKTLIADLLEYGAAAQKYFDYDLDNLVNSDETIATKASEFNSPESSVYETTGEKCDKAYFNEIGVCLDNDNKLSFEVYSDDIDNVVVKEGGRELACHENDGAYVYYTDGIYATDFGRAYTVTLYYKGVAYESVTYSVDSYVYEIMRVSPNEKLVNLAQKLYSYGRSANAFKAATKYVDVFIFMGQSNMAGRGNYQESVEVEEGTAFEYRPVTGSDENGWFFKLEEPFGRNENNAALSDPGNGGKNGGLVSSFARAYYEVTGVPVIGVSASVGGTSIKKWVPGTAYYEESVKRLVACVEQIKKEGVYTIGHINMVWCQGESDSSAAYSESIDYDGLLKSIVYGLQNLGDASIEKCFVITPSEGSSDSPGVNDKKVAMADRQIALCRSDDNFVLASIKFRNSPEALRDNGPHFRQAVYNVVGIDSGKRVAEFIYKGIVTQAEPFYFGEEVSIANKYGATLTYYTEGEFYYFDSDAKEGGDGSICSPYNDLNMLSEIAFGKNCYVLIKCGSAFTCNISPSAVKDGVGNSVEFMSYGIGDNPVINGVVFNEWLTK